MVKTEKVTMSIGGIVCWFLPQFCGRHREDTDYDWLGTLTLLMFFGIGLWAIREALT